MKLSKKTLRKTLRTKGCRYLDHKKAHHVTSTINKDLHQGLSLWNFESTGIKETPNAPHRTKSRSSSEAEATGWIHSTWKQGDNGTNAFKISMQCSPTQSSIPSHTTSQLWTQNKDTFRMQDLNKMDFPVPSRGYWKMLFATNERQTQESRV